MEAVRTSETSTNFHQTYTIWHPTSSKSPPWEPKIQQTYFYFLWSPFLCKTLLIEESVEKSKYSQHPVNHEALAEAINSTLQPVIKEISFIISTQKIWKCNDAMR
jgi:hypothetical protein